MSRHLLSLPCLVLALLLLPACGGGGSAGPKPAALGQPPTDTLVVTNHNDVGPGSLRQAIADAPPGAWIVFDDALPAGDVVISTPLVIDKVLTIGGLDAIGLRHGVDAQSLSAIFTLQDGALQLNDMVLHHAMGLDGGAIEGFDQAIVLWRCHIHSCEAAGYGGALHTRASVHAYDCFFESNQSGGTGGAIAATEAFVRIERCAFYGNVAQHGGALRAHGGDVTLVNCAFHENTATLGSGGAIYAVSYDTPCLLGIYNNTISENHAAVSGGGIHVWGNDSLQVELEMHRTIVALNTAPTDRDTSRAEFVLSSGTWNLIGVGAGMYFQGVGDNGVGDAVTPLDPGLLVPLALPDGRVVSFPLPAGLAVDAVPAGQNWSPEGPPMVVDLRLFPRFPAANSDIGAIEL